MAAPPKEEQHWQMMQKRTFTRYMNSKLRCRGIEVGDLYEDLKSGIVLYNFLEVLTGESLKKHGKLNTGKLRIQRVANQNVVFKFFPEADIKLENIGVMDIVDGTPTPVLGLIWSIIAFYLVKELGESGDDLAAVKKKILKWAKKKAQRRVAIHNLTDSFADGKAFLAILNDVDNAGSPYRPDEKDTKANFRAAFHDAEVKYGVPQMLDPEDENLWADEISMLTYLATMMDTLPDHVPQPNPDLLVNAYVDEHVDEVFDDELYKLCQCKSYENDAQGLQQAKAVARAMLDKTFSESAAGDAGPAIVEDAGDCLVASWDVAGPDAPTVLVYATTGLSGEGDSEWFEPSKTESVLSARGAMTDKSNVAAAIFAVRALRTVLNGEEHAPFPACNAVLVLGSLPPQLAARAIGENPSVRKAVLKADYVLVSETGQSLQQPGSSDDGCFGAIDRSHVKAAALYGCRGWAKADFECRLSSSSSQTRGVSCAAHVGPVVDPALALATKLGALRDADSAAPSRGRRTVAGLPSLSLDLVDFRKGGEEGIGHDDEEATKTIVAKLKKAVGYDDKTLTAPEFAASTKGDPFAALALEPGLVVEALTTTTTTPPPRRATRTFSPQTSLPASASAAIKLYLPPGYDNLDAAVAKVHRALDSSEEDNAVSASFDVNVIGKTCGQVGYLSDSRQPFAETVTAALGRAHDGDETSTKVALAASPVYAPVPCAFAALNGDAAVFQVGPVPEAFEGGRESVRKADVAKHTKAIARVLNTMKSVPKVAPKLDARYGVEDETEVPQTFQKKTTTTPTIEEDDAAAAVSPPIATNKVVDAPPPPPPPPPPAVVEEPVAAPEEEEEEPFSSRGEVDELEPLAVVDAEPKAKTKTEPEEEEEEEEDAPVAGEEYKEEPPPPEAAPETVETPPPPPPPEPLTEAALIEALNSLRRDPAAYASILEASLPLYRDDMSFWPKEPGAQPFMTHEGTKAVEEAIAYLSSVDATSSRRKPLVVHEGMCEAAMDHASDLVKSGDRLGHTGSDGSKPADRLSRHGRWFERASECLAYRHASAAMLVAQLVVDDGMPDRKQRQTALSPDMRAVGVAVAHHPSHGALAVFTLAGGYGPPPLDHDALVATTPGVPPSDDFKRVLDSIPVVAVHEQVEQALERGDRVELNYQPGALKMTIWTPNDDAGQMFGVDWEN